MGARPAMAGGERAHAWRAVVLGAGPSGQNPVPPIAAGSRLRHGGKRRHRILSRPLLKAAFVSTAIHRIGGRVDSHEIAITAGLK